ncbi:MAG: T9SS type A sorting domain-containing protein, partial [Bacteroidota bacterium]
LDGCSKYDVEGNELSSAIVDNGTGIIISNISSKITMLYRNTFEDLENGTTAVGNNQGLQIRCNDYSGGNANDILVSRLFPSGSVGKLPSQGMIDPSGPDTPAGNQFRNYRGPCGGYHINRSGAVTSFTYFRHDISVPYDPVCLPTVTPPAPPLFVTVTPTDDIDDTGDCGPSNNYLKSALLETPTFETLDNINSNLNSLRQSNNPSDESLDAQIESLLADKVTILKQDNNQKPLLNFLETEQHPYAKEQLFLHHFNRRDFNKAQAALNQLQSDQERWQADKAFYAVLLSQAQAGRAGGDFTEQERLQFLDIAQTDAPASVKAHQLLNRYFDGTYEEYIPKADPGAFDAEAEKASQEFSLAPNPTSGKLDIQLKLANTSANTLLEIYNINGQPVHQRELSPVDDQRFQINLGNLPGGIYFAIVRQDGAIIEKQKFILAK